MNRMDRMLFNRFCVVCGRKIPPASILERYL